MAEYDVQTRNVHGNVSVEDKAPMVAILHHVAKKEEMKTSLGVGR